MAITISVSLQKGGTGKTTTAVVLSGILGRELGKKVLLVDMDSQCNATYISGAEADHTIIDVFTEDCTLNDAIVKRPHYDIIAAGEELANFERLEEIESAHLRNELAAVEHLYDFIIIDTPPALGNILKTCLVASDFVLTPVEAKPLAIKGLAALNETIEAVQSEYGSPKILGVAIVKYDNRSNLSRQMKEYLEEQVTEINTSVFNTVIREGIAVAESQIMQQDLIDYASKSKPCQDYVALANEILERLGV